MNRRIIVAVLAVIAIIIFEIYMRIQVNLSGDIIYECYPTGQVFIELVLPENKFAGAQEIVLK